MQLAWLFRLILKTSYSTYHRSIVENNNQLSNKPSCQTSILKREEYNILGTAHLKLAIAYTKKGWWEYALNEAKRSFELTPNKDCHDLIALINEKIALRTEIK